TKTLDKMSLNILITGASGFIGRNLTTELIQAGHKVTALTRKPPSPPLADGQVKIIQGELNDYQSLLPAVADQQLIFHLAGAVIAKRTRDYYRINVQGTENLIRAVLAKN